MWCLPQAEDNRTCQMNPCLRVSERLSYYYCPLNFFQSLKKSLADSNKKHITIIQNEISPDKEKVATIELEKID